MTTNTPKDDDCKTCFGEGTIPVMRPVTWGQPNDPSRHVCAACKGTGLKPKAD